MATDTGCSPVSVLQRGVKLFIMNITWFCGSAGRSKQYKPFREATYFFLHKSLTTIIIWLLSLPTGQIALFSYVWSNLIFDLWTLKIIAITLSLKTNFLIWIWAWKHVLWHLWPPMLDVHAPVQVNICAKSEEIPFQHSWHIMFTIMGWMTGGIT